MRWPGQTVRTGMRRPRASYRRKSSRRGGRFEYRRARTRAVDTPSATADMEPAINCCRPMGGVCQQGCTAPLLSGEYSYGLFSYGSKTALPLLADLYSYGRYKYGSKTALRHYSRVYIVMAYGRYKYGSKTALRHYSRALPPKPSLDGCGMLNCVINSNATPGESMRSL